MLSHHSPPVVKELNPAVLRRLRADPITLSNIVATTQSSVTPPGFTRIERAQRGKRGADNPAEPAQCANRAGSARVAGFGEGGADGADHLIGLAVKVVGG